MRHGHGEALLPMIDTVVREAGLSPAALGVVAVSTGPGGFTGIRVGLAAARGIATAVGVPLIGVSSFAAVAGKIAACPAHRRILIALDSRRAELYVQPLSGAGRPLAPPAAVLPGDLAQFVATTIGAEPLQLAGDAVDIAASALAAHADVEVAAGSVPDALGVLAAARRALREGTDLEPARPLYIRAPDVTLAKMRLRAATAKKSVGQ
jgi:tRNA threonylcarbamoyladenosine biosynthesis protein TsaB